MSSKSVRVRFAPSPTGPLHIGGVRTALYNYLFAKKHGGQLILRIEDTDQTRFVEGAQQYIIDSFKWCGIEFDEGVTKGGPFGPYVQSERQDIYQQYSEQLIASGHAYYAFDTPEQLDALRKAFEADKKTFTYNAEVRGQLNNSLNMSAEMLEKALTEGVPYVVRFAMPADKVVVMNDLIRGKVEVNTRVLDDKVLFKSDGMPTYHLANIVDDHLMEISHVIRGEEWLPSLPLHVLLYEAFGWQAPEFAHLPLLLKPEGNGKLSKRDGDRLGFPVFPLEWKDPISGDVSRGYREDGYFPEAFVNMLAMLGWNPGTEQELFTMNQLAEVFTIERVGKSGAKFDPAKAAWFNHQYLIQKSDAELAQLLMPIIREKGYLAEPGFTAKIIGLVKERVNFVSELWEQVSFFFASPETYDSQAVKKRWKSDSFTQMTELKELLASTSDFIAPHLEEVTKAWIEEKGYGMGAVMNAFRLIVVGALKGPHLFDIVAIIGQEETLNRLERGLHELGRKDN